MIEYGIDNDPSLDFGTSVRNDGSGSNAALDLLPAVLPKFDDWAAVFAPSSGFASGADGEASSVAEGISSADVWSAGVISSVD
jgi:hypothetical protein